ncbi:unnamed protein product, partial [marine sediment metagenome]
MDINVIGSSDLLVASDHDRFKASQGRGPKDLAAYRAAAAVTYFND